MSLGVTDLKGFIPQTGSMSLLVDRHDWAATALGPRPAWPQSLRTTVDLVLASGHAMCLAWGPDRIFLYNDAYAPILGARHPAALGAPFAAVWADVWADIAPLVELTFQGITSTHQDMPLVMTRHGYAEETWWSFSYSPVRDERGEVAGLLNVTLETTGRVLTERERDTAVKSLRRQKERMSSLVTTSADSIYEMSADWTEMRLLEGRGFIADTTAPTVRWMDAYLFPEDQASIRQAIDQAIAAKEPFRLKHRVRRADGRAGWVASHAVPILDAQGEITEWFGMAADVTARQEAEAALQASEAFTRSVLASSTDCIKVLSPDGAIDFISEGGLRVMEISDFNQVRGCPWPGLLEGAGREQAQAAIAAALRGETSAFECGARTFQGTPKWWSVSVSPIHDGSGVVTRILSVSRDISELRAAMEQEHLLNGELSHRLKNTLAVVQAIASQTLGSATNEDAMASFTSRLGALSAAHSVLVSGHWSAAALRDVAEAALASFDQGQRFQMAGPDLTVGPRATLSLSLLLHELATNAMKHGALSVPGGHIRLDWTLHHEAEEPMLVMRWAERGGPPAREPERRGFGSRIIRMGLTGAGDVELDYGAEGLTARFSATITDIQHG
jgi:PAS domain S-box-containing protein